MLFEVIEKNKRRSVIAFIITAVWFTVIYGSICAFLLISLFAQFIGKTEYEKLFNNGGIILTLGAAAALGIFLYKFLSERNKPYEISGCSLYRVNKKSNQALYNAAEEISIAAGLSRMPAVYVLDSSILNAYACGINPKNSSIVISKGLLEILNRNELQGVIAHEMSHIINRDTMYLLCTGLLCSISAGFTHVFWAGAKRGGKGSGGALLLALISWIGQSICFVLFFFISRKREYLADACAAVYTRYPKGLADALLKIENAAKKGRYNIYDDFDEDNANHLVKASFFAPAAKDNIKKDCWKSTHPSTENRIKILLNMKSADYREYEKQFEKLNNKKLLPESALKNEEKIKINPNFIPPPLEGEGARSAGEGYTDAFDYSLRNESLQTGAARHARTLGSSQNIETHPSHLTPLPQGARGNISTALPQGETIFAACSLSSVISDETQMQTIKENKELLNENIKKHREVEDMVQDLAGYTIINCDCCTKLKIPPVYKNQIIICPHCGKKHVLPAE